MGSFVERSHLLTAISVVARAWRYRLHRRHAPGLVFVCDRSDERRKDTKTSEFDKEKTTSNHCVAQLLSGLETRHPAAAGPTPAYNFSVFDEQKAVFLVSVLDCFESDSSAGFGSSKLKLEHCLS